MKPWTKAALFCAAVLVAPAAFEGVRHAVGTPAAFTAVVLILLAALVPAWLADRAPRAPAAKPAAAAAPETPATFPPAGPLGPPAAL